MLLLLGVCDSCTVTKPGLCQAQKSGEQASRGPNGTHHALKFKETPARGTGSWGPLGTCEEEQGCPLRELESRLSALPAGVHATRAAKAQVQTLPRGFPTSFLYCLTPWVRSQTTGTRIPGGVLRMEPAGSRAASATETGAGNAPSHQGLREPPRFHPCKDVQAIGDAAPSTHHKGQTPLKTSRLLDRRRERPRTSQKDAALPSERRQVAAERRLGGRAPRHLPGAVASPRSPCRSLRCPGEAFGLP